MINVFNVKDFFLNLLRTRATSRHFRRLAILEMLKGANSTIITNELPSSLVENLTVSSQRKPDELLKTLSSNLNGLTDTEADSIRERVGLNEVQHEKPLSWQMHLWVCYKNPFNLLLTTLAGISWYTEDMKATVVISLMVALSTLIRFVQESKSNKAADKLREMVSNTATVMRRDDEKLLEEAQKYFGVTLHPKGPRAIEIPIKDLVPGDIIQLAAGDMIPADLRILSAKDLFLNQSAMTGESLPVEKFATLQDDNHKKNPLELDNICFMGTNVVSGSSIAVVIATGSQTFFGLLAARSTTVNRAPTAFQSGINKVSWLLIRFMLVMTPLVLLINGLTKGDWLEAALFALSIAVGLTPEMLPMIVTSTLAKGAVILSRKKVIVKRLDAIQNFGAMDVLLTDKTGTLTQDKIFLERHTDVWGEESEDVLEYAYLNSYYQTGLKNLLDTAVLDHANLHNELGVGKNYYKVDEIPFDFQRRRMSVIIAEQDNTHSLICKGAVEEILSTCSRVRHGDNDEILTSELLAKIRKTTRALNEEGLRVVAVAAKQLPLKKETYSVSDENDLTLIGYIAFLDPPKDSTAPALKMLKERGVDVKVLTGDNELVTAKICREVGLPINNILLGQDIDQMDNIELSHAAETTTIFARLNPAHKERIVRILHDKGHVVGFMGDGINDAPALRAADIGISVDTAVDIAKEAADVILLEKSLMVLEQGVIEGRKTFANMLKYIKMTASSNFGNVFSVLIASVFLPFLPMLPLQLLVQNLLYDISQVAIPFDNVDEEFLSKPQTWDSDNLGRFMIFFGPVSSIFDILTYTLMWFVFQANTPEQQSLFQAGWFIEGLLSQTLIVHMIRTRYIPFFGSCASTSLLFTTAAVMSFGIFLPISMFATYFKFQALPLDYFYWLAAILVAYMVLAQAMKSFYARRYGW